jgi:hypothetical protein
MVKIFTLLFSASNQKRFYIFKTCKHQTTNTFMIVWLTNSICKWNEKANEYNITLSPIAYFHFSLDFVNYILLLIRRDISNVFVIYKIKSYKFQVIFFYQTLTILLVIKLKVIIFYLLIIFSSKFQVENASIHNLSKRNKSLDILFLPKNDKL